MDEQEKKRSAEIMAKVVGAYRALCDAMLAGVEAAGADGVPEGHIYAAMMSAVPELTLCRFEAVRNILIAAGRIRRDGAHLLFAIVDCPHIDQEINQDGRMWCISCGQFIEESQS